jgi:hypothetical protein
MSLGEAVFFDSFSRFDLWIVLLCWALVSVVSPNLPDAGALSIQI